MHIDLRDSDAPMWHAMYRMRLDGQDVSSQCFYADDEERLAGLYLADAEGTAITTRTGPAVEWRRGKVELIAPERSEAIASAAFMLDRVVSEFGLDSQRVPRYFRDLHEALQLPRPAERAVSV